MVFSESILLLWCSLAYSVLFLQIFYSNFWQLGISPLSQCHHSILTTCMLKGISSNERTKKSVTTLTMKIDWYNDLIKWPFLGNTNWTQWSVLDNLDNIQETLPTPVLLLSRWNESCGPWSTFVLLILIPILSLLSISLLCLLFQLNSSCDACACYWISVTKRWKVSNPIIKRPVFYVSIEQKIPSL